MTMREPSLQQRAQRIADGMGQGHDASFVQMLMRLLMRGGPLPTLKGKKPNNYTKPKLRERLKAKIMAGTKGGKAGQWSARKAQLLAQQYEAQGGGYKGKKTKKQRSLSTWSKQEWTTPSGKPSGKTGEVYAPKKTIAALQSTKEGRKKLKQANRKKRQATKEGRQHSDHGLHEGKDRSNTKKSLETALNWHFELYKGAVQYTHVSKAVGAPAGYEPVPGSKHGGFRKKVGSGYDYWYPSQSQADKAAKHHEKQAKRAERMLSLIMRMKKTTPAQLESMMDKIESHQQHSAGSRDAHREKTGDAEPKKDEGSKTEAVAEKPEAPKEAPQEQPEKKPEEKPKPKEKRKSDAKVSKEVLGLGPIPEDFEDAAFTTAEVDSIRDAIARGLLEKDGKRFAPTDKLLGLTSKKKPKKSVREQSKEEGKKDTKNEAKTDDDVREAFRRIAEEDKAKREKPPKSTLRIPKVSKEALFAATLTVERGGYAANKKNLRNPKFKELMDAGLVHVKDGKIQATLTGQRAVYRNAIKLAKKQSPVEKGKGVDESVWSEAKKLARKQGQSKNYAYIMGIYKRLKGSQRVAGATDQRKPPRKRGGVSKSGPFIGPRGGKWADAKHTIPYVESGRHGTGKMTTETESELARRKVEANRKFVRDATAKIATESGWKPSGTGYYEGKNGAVRIMKRGKAVLVHSFSKAVAEYQSAKPTR